MSVAPTYRPHERVPGTPYKVIRFLGAGGMGAVYEVEDTTIGKRYVLKTVNVDFAESAGTENAAQMLNQEARMLAQVSHPNIVDVITAGRTDDRYRLPFLVMEKLDGVTLRTMLDRLVLPRPSIAQIAEEMLDALLHLHRPEGDRAPMLHRDIKPENIFLAKERERRYTTKLLDLGIAVLLDGPSHGIHGTPLYMAPEQLRGDLLDERTDLYQAGVVLFEMIAGHHPFPKAQTISEASAAHLYQTPPRLSSLVDIDPSVDAIIAAALSKEREKRPRDARLFADGLAALRGPSAATLMSDHLRSALEAERANGYAAYATGHATIQAGKPSELPRSSLMGMDLSPEPVRVATVALPRAAPAPITPASYAISPASPPVSSGQPWPNVAPPVSAPGGAPQAAYAIPMGAGRTEAKTARLLVMMFGIFAFALLGLAALVLWPVRATSTPALPSAPTTLAASSLPAVTPATTTAPAAAPASSTTPEPPSSSTSVPSPSTQPARSASAPKAVASPKPTPPANTEPRPVTPQRPDFFPLSLPTASPAASGPSTTPRPSR